MRMPFGKFKGLPVCELPATYLHWLENNVFLQGELAEEVRRAITGEPAPEDPEAVVTRVVKSFEDQLERL